jgi:hypothetical protein
MLGEVGVRYAKAAQWAEARVDAVNGAWFSGEFFDELTTTLDEWSGFGGNFARYGLRGDTPCVVD